MATAEALRKAIEPDIDRHDQAVQRDMKDQSWLRDLKESLRQLARGELRNWRDVYPGTE
jgi:hypothetical protein